MKQFTFYFLKQNGERAAETISANNQGKAIAIFKSRQGFVKILNISKERKRNG